VPTTIPFGVKSPDPDEHTLGVRVKGAHAETPLLQQTELEAPSIDATDDDDDDEEEEVWESLTDFMHSSLVHEVPAASGTIKDRMSEKSEQRDVGSSSNALGRKSPLAHMFGIGTRL